MCRGALPRKRRVVKIGVSPMGKGTDRDISKEQKKLSRSLADKLALLKKTKRETSHTGLVQMVFDVTPETKAKLEALARESGMSLSQAAGIILEAQIAKHKKLEEAIRRTISEAMQEENQRFEEELVRSGQPFGIVDQPWYPHPCEKDPEDRAGDRQHQRLDHQKTDHTGSGRAERKAEGDLSSACHTMHRDQARDIRARDQENEHTHRRQHAKRR